MSEIVVSSLFDEQLELGLLAIFAAMAVGLAAAGIYGVMAYGIAQRTHEFGIRLALGATAADIVRLVAGHGLRLTAAGIGIGLVGAWLLSSALSTEVYGLGARDPIVYGATALLLSIIALAACIVPARRALRISPLTALRGE
jgi:ABC-type antimicrobial peptide transport system permease subunit